MRFFEKCRPSFYFHGARLIQNGKTQKQYWRLNLVITLKATEVISCGELIQSNYEAIETRDNLMEEIKIAAEVNDQVVEFFALENQKGPALTVRVGALDEMRMTRIESLTELWVRAEIENTDRVHMFVREHVFTRLWVEFSPAQKSLPLDNPVARALAGEAVQLTMSDGTTGTLTADVGGKKKKPN